MSPRLPVHSGCTWGLAYTHCRYWAMKAFTACKKSLKFSQKWRENWPLAKKIWARGGLRVVEKKLFKKQFWFKNVFSLEILYLWGFFQEYHLRKSSMLVTQSPSQIAMSKLLPGKGNPIMRNITLPSSPQWVHMGLGLHPLPLLVHEGFKSL